MEDIKIERTEVIKVQDGDVVAVFFKGKAPEQAIERLCMVLHAAFLPKNVVVKAFNADMVEIKVLRPE